MILLYIAEMERVSYKMPEKCCPEVKKSFPEGFIGGVVFSKGHHNHPFQLIIQIIDEYILVLEIPIDGAHGYFGLLCDHRHGGAVESLFRD